MISFSLTHHHSNHQQISLDLLSKYMQNPITAPLYHQSDWGITLSCQDNCRVSLLVSLPQICSLFLVQETKRYIKNISWVISLFSSKPSNGFFLTQSKIQVLTRMDKKPYTIWSLPLCSHLLLPPLPSFTLCRHTGLFATLSDQKFFCLRPWAHTIPLTEDFFLPRLLQATPSPTSGICKHLFFTLLFQTQPNLHLNSLSSFPALFFSIELPVIKWLTIYWLILLLIFFRLEYTSDWHFVHWLINPQH